MIYAYRERKSAFVQTIIACEVKKLIEKGCLLPLDACNFQD